MTDDAPSLDLPGGMRGRAAGASAGLKLAVALSLGSSVAAFTLRTGRVAPLLGWDAAALTFMVWTWASVWPFDAAATASHSQRENPARAFADIALLAAAGASVLAVGVVLFEASRASGPLKYLEAGSRCFRSSCRGP